MENSDEDSLAVPPRARRYFRWLLKKVPVKFRAPITLIIGIALVVPTFGLIGRNAQTAYNWSRLRAEHLYCDYLKSPLLLDDNSRIDVLMARLKGDDESEQSRLVASSVEDLFGKSGGVIYGTQYCRRLTEIAGNVFPDDIRKASLDSHADIFLTGEVFRPDRRLRLTMFTRQNYDGLFYSSSREFGVEPNLTLGVEFQNALVNIVAQFIDIKSGELSQEIDASPAQTDIEKSIAYLANLYTIAKKIRSSDIGSRKDVRCWMDFAIGRVALNYSLYIENRDRMAEAEAANEAILANPDCENLHWPAKYNLAETLLLLTGPDYDPRLGAQTATEFDTAKEIIRKRLSRAEVLYREYLATPKWGTDNYLYLSAQNGRARALHRLGVMGSSTEYLDKAIAQFTDYISLLEKSNLTDRDFYVAEARYNMGLSQLVIPNRRGLAIQSLQQSATLFKRIGQTSRATFVLDVVALAQQQSVAPNGPGKLPLQELDSKSKVQLPRSSRPMQILPDLSGKKPLYAP